MSESDSAYVQSLRQKHQRRTMIDEAVMNTAKKFAGDHWHSFLYARWRRKRWSKGFDHALRHEFRRIAVSRQATA